MKSLVDALLADLAAKSQRFEIRPETIYFGGGTPTLLNQSALSRLLDGICAQLDLSELAEWSTEANPMTFDQKKATLLHSHGINRVSLGVQSWQPDLLTTLGRDHSPEQALDSYHLLSDTGFSVVNLDLMFSLPGQSLETWEKDLLTTLDLKSQHISAYNLTYEEDTPFFEQLGKGNFREDVDDNADHFYLADRLLTAAGLQHYEISNYAQPGCESLHNQAYWAGKDYLGLGPSAVSTIGTQRWQNVPDTARYTAEGAIAVNEETLSEADLHNERVALMLRTSQGIHLGTLTATSQKRAQDLQSEGVLEFADDHCRLTARHRAMVDPVAAELFI
jgi:oxygen-independent coproporphyrinogen-3 oxidase